MPYILDYTIQLLDRGLCFLQYAWLRKAKSPAYVIHDVFYVREKIARVRLNDL
jgi:hypothetical protein